MPPLKRSGTSVGPPKSKRRRRKSTLSVPKTVAKSGSFRKARVVKFQRSQASVLLLNNTSPPAGWADNANGVVTVFVTTLGSIPGYTDYTALFDSYRITGVRLQGYYSGTNSNRDDNQNAMLLVCPNQMGNAQSIALDEQWFMDRPRTKKIPLMNDMGKSSFDEYFPLSQLSETYGSTVNTDYALTAPQFISTGEPGASHYGCAIRFQRMDGEPFSLSPTVARVKIITTWYLEVRGAGGV